MTARDADALVSKGYKSSYGELPHHFCAHCKQCFLIQEPHVFNLSSTEACKRDYQSIALQTVQYLGYT